MQIKEIGISKFSVGMDRYLSALALQWTGELCRQWPRLHPEAAGRMQEQQQHFIQFFIYKKYTLNKTKNI